MPPQVPPAGPGRFPTTRWTLILSAQAGDGARHTALETLCAAYWKPVYLYMRRKGLDVDAAQDAVQGLFTELIERNFIERLDPAKGRLRGYLRGAADHYLSHQRAAQGAEKRGGRTRIVPIDTEGVEPLLVATSEDPLATFEREWALAVMSRALERLRAEYADGRRRGNADVVFRFFGVGPAPSYAEAAEEAQVSVAQFRATLHRARTRFREILREEVADTVDDGGADAELSELLRILST